MKNGNEDGRMQVPGIFMTPECYRNPYARLNRAYGLADQRKPRR